MNFAKELLRAISDECERTKALGLSLEFLRSAFPAKSEKEIITALKAAKSQGYLRIDTADNTIYAVSLTKTGKELVR